MRDSLLSMSGRIIGLCRGELPLACFVLSPVHQPAEAHYQANREINAVIIRKSTKYCNTFRFLKLFVSIFAGMAQFLAKREIGFKFRPLTEKRMIIII